MSFDSAIDTLRAGITDLFAPYAVSGRGELAFYPARLQNPILEVGAGRKLLRFTYDGVSRLVESYALTFKRRQDGVGSEYPLDRYGAHRRVRCSVLEDGLLGGGVTYEPEPAGAQ